MSGGEELQKVVQDTRVIVDQLAPFTNYSFYVRAYNARSTSQPSAFVTELTEEDGESKSTVFHRLFHTALKVKIQRSHPEIYIPPLTYAYECCFSQTVSCAGFKNPVTLNNASN